MSYNNHWSYRIRTSYNHLLTTLCERTNCSKVRHSPKILERKGRFPACIPLVLLVWGVSLPLATRILHHDQLHDTFFWILTFCGCWQNVHKRAISCQGAKFHIALLFVKWKKLHIEFTRAFEGRWRNPRIHAITLHQHIGVEFLHVTCLKDLTISTVRKYKGRF